MAAEFYPKDIQELLPSTDKRDLWLAIASTRGALTNLQASELDTYAQTIDLMGNRVGSLLTEPDDLVARFLLADKDIQDQVAKYRQHFRDLFQGKILTDTNTWESLMMLAQRKPETLTPVELEHLLYALTKDEPTTESVSKKPNSLNSQLAPIPQVVLLQLLRLYGADTAFREVVVGFKADKALKAFQKEIANKKRDIEVAQNMIKALLTEREICTQACNLSAKAINDAVTTDKNALSWQELLEVRAIRANVSRTEPVIKDRLHAIAYHPSASVRRQISELEQYNANRDEIDDINAEINALKEQITQAQAFLRRAE